MDTITKLIGIDGNSGPYFERWVMEALCVMGRQEKALLRMANRYRGQIDASFTTLWEYMERGFDVKTGTDAVNYLTLNHAWNNPNTILSKFIAGVAPESPGWTALSCIAAGGVSDFYRYHGPDRSGAGVSFDQKNRVKLQSVLNVSFKHDGHRRHSQEFVHETGFNQGQWGGNLERFIRRER